MIELVRKGRGMGGWGGEVFCQVELLGDRVANYNMGVVGG